MTLLGRVANALSRVFPNHVRVMKRELQDYAFTNDAKVTVELASVDALAYGQVQPTPERLFLAALENDSLVERLTKKPEFAVEKLREALLVSLARPEVVAEARAVRPSPRYASVLAQALERSRRHQRAAIGMGDVLAGIASTEGEASRLAGPLAIDFAAFDTKLVEALASPATAGDTRVSVWTLDDTTSTMEDVMRILEHGFGISVRRAWHVMMTTHYEGHARVGTYSRADADAHLARAKSHAEARKSPLRFHVGKG